MGLAESVCFDVTRLNYYTTNVDEFFEAHDLVTNRCPGRAASHRVRCWASRGWRFPDFK